MLWEKILNLDQNLDQNFLTKVLACYKNHSGYFFICSINKVIKERIFKIYLASFYWKFWLLEFWLSLKEITI